MRFPAPDDPANAPVWDNYVVAQASQAALGAIADDVVALGVEVHGARVTVVVLRTTQVEHDDDVLDASDIVSDLEALLGPAVEVDLETRISNSWRPRPDEPVRWIYAKRISDSGY